MAGEIDILASSIPPELLKNIDTLVTFFQIFGGVVLIYIIIGIVNLVINRKKNLELKRINENLAEIKRILKRKR